jgi:integrase
LVRRELPTAPRALTPSQVNALLRETQRGRYPARDYAIVQMLVQTGMRIGECAALRWGDMTLREKGGQVLIRSGKGNQARLVPLNGSIRQALAEYAATALKVSPTLKAVSAAWPVQDPALSAMKFWRSQKGALTLVSMDRLVKALLRSCARRGLLPEETTAHSLRHTFATRYLTAQPGDLVGLARLLGHRSLDSTRIYVQPTQEQLAAWVEHIDLNAYPG